MLREIKHSCGHKESYDIRRGQFAKTKKFYEQRLCTACWKEHEYDRRKKAAEDNARNGLRALRGDKFSISQAELIRHEFFSFVKHNPTNCMNYISFR